MIARTSSKMVETTLKYIARDKLYEAEKPYSVEFEIDKHVSADAKQTNHILVSQPVAVTAIEASDNFTLDTHGFCVINARTSLQVDDALMRPENVEVLYLDEIKDILQDYFPEYRRLEGMEFVVCIFFFNVENLC